MRKVVDVLFALLGLILFLPLLLLIVILIRLDSPGPVLYTPLMIGQHGRIFRLLRFRTMHMNAAQLPAGQRLTRFGKLIRNYSLDHLPMLINLLNGDLTLIGPRPMEPSLVDMQDQMWKHYFEAKPGLFNYAVLKLGKLWTPMNVADPAINRALELEYLQRRSTSFDIQLLIRSLQRLIISRGNIKARSEPDADIKAKRNKDSD